MSKDLGKFHSLSRRIVVQFCVFTLVISAVYGLLSLVLLYALEDNFIEKDIMREAAYLSSQYQTTGKWPATRSHNMQLHFSKSTLPEDFRNTAIEEPQRKEFFGKEGRHYHLFQFSEYANVYLVAEVSNELLVRPMRGGVIQLLVISGLIVTLIACLIAWFIGRKTTHPLKQLAVLVDGVAPEQLPDKFALHFPNNEVGILARTLEQTLNRTSDAFKREKSFTRDVSHELRTPLAVIKNAVELCQTQQSSTGTNNAVLERIYDAAQQMEKTVNTLLILARQEHAPGDNSPCNLMPIVERSIIDNRILLADKQIDIDIHDSCHTNINADASMLKVLLDNLLSNAFKYTESGGVHIAYFNNRLIVKDTGPGIDPDIASHIDVPGVKGQQSSGFGFGLSIVKRLCEHQGWQMDVQSSNGTTVTVRFDM